MATRTEQTSPDTANWCEMGKQTLWEGDTPTCEFPLPQSADYVVTVGEQPKRKLCSICTDKAVSAAVGMGENVQAVRLEDDGNWTPE